MAETIYDTEEQIDQEPQQEDPKPKLKVKDFAAKIKAKYPEYKDVDDLELTNRIIAKYPDYKDQVDFDVEKKNLGGTPFTSDPHAYLQNFGNGLPQSDSNGLSQDGVSQSDIGNTLTTGYTATDSRVGGDKSFNNEHIGGALKSIGKGAALGFGTGLANIPKGIGIAAKEIDLFNEYEGHKAEELATYRAGKWIEETTKDLVGELTPEEQKKMSVKLAVAGGNMATLMVGGIGAKALGASTILTTAAMGALQQGTSEYENAEAMGATPDQASKAFWINAVIGTTDAWPMVGAFRKLDKYSGGLATGALAKKLASTAGGRIASDIATGFVVEAAQEAGQQILTNITAKNTYDATREIFDGVGESFGIGGIIGGTMRGVLSGIREKRAAGNLTPEEDAQLVKAEEFALKKIEEDETKTTTDEKVVTEGNPPNQQGEQQPAQEIQPSQQPVEEVQGATEEKQVNDFDTFKGNMLEAIENVKDSSFDHVISLTLNDQKSRQQALKNIREGKDTKASQSLLNDIQQMYDDGYVYLNRGQGSNTERIQIPIKEYMDEVNKPLTIEDLDELNTLLGEEAFNSNFDNAYDYERQRSTETSETPTTAASAAGEGITETPSSKSAEPAIEKILQERDEVIEKISKPNLKMEFAKAKELVDSNDPIKNREVHNDIKERYKNLRKIIDCLWGKK